MGRDEGGHLKEEESPAVKNELKGTENGTKQATETEPSGSAQAQGTYGRITGV